MNRYIIRPDAIAVAREKQTSADQAAHLQELEHRLGDLIQAEQTLFQRLSAERQAKGAADPVLSRAAREQVDASAEAMDRVHELQRRRIRRAETAAQVVACLLDDVRFDLEDSEWLAAETAGDPGHDISLELVEAKRAMLKAMEDFVDRWR